MEEILVYYKDTGTYNPQMVGDKSYKKRMMTQTHGNQYFTTSENAKVPEKSYETEEGGHQGRYPTTYKDWEIRKDGTGITRTDEHIDYFIKTYSNQGDTVLDMTCHNQYVGDRCLLLDREYIGVDIDLKI